MTTTLHDNYLGALRALSTLLQYPGEEFENRLHHTRSCLLSCPAAQAHLDPFANAMSPMCPDNRQELYTATFDVTPACVPYVSIYLFGEENYKRGEFMAALHARYAQLGFERPRELPDHLANLLAFTALVDESEREELITYCLLGPIATMLSSLNQTNPYRSLLECVHAVLRAAYPNATPALSPLEQMRRHGEGCAVAAPSCGCSMLQPPSEAATAPLAAPAQQPILNR